MVKKIEQPSVPTWTELNNVLRDCDEETAFELLKTAKKVRPPFSLLFIQRIYARYNKLRKDRELRELALIK